MIAKFRGAYGFLSNFWTCPVEMDGVTYPSVEHAYQAAKCFAPANRAKFLTGKPGDAKRLGKRIAIRKGWEDVKLEIMLSLVRKKFENPELQDKLMDTLGEELREGNDWGDLFWGVDDYLGVGENHLGKILMQVRSEIAEAPF